MNRPHVVLFALLLCSCTGPAGAREGSEAADWGPRPFLDRSNPLVEHTFEIMEVRAAYSYLRELHRSNGGRVCEEGENETEWKQDCNTCRCEWGVRSCTKAGCPSPAARAELRAKAKRDAREKAELYRGLREPPPSVPTDDDDDTSSVGWNPAVDYRELYPSISRRLCEGETSWKESCNTCWCEGGFVVCSKVDCPSSYHPKGTAATDDTE